MRAPAGIVLVDSLAELPLRLLGGVQDKEWPGPLVHEICRAARHVADGLPVAQNIVTAVCGWMAGRGLERP
jgi:hypothetical protein